MCPPPPPPSRQYATTSMQSELRISLKHQAKTPRGLWCACAEVLSIVPITISTSMLALLAIHQAAHRDD